MIYFPLRSCGWFAEMRVTWQLGVTSINALEERFVMITAGVIDLGAYAYNGHFRSRAISRVAGTVDRHGIVRERR